MSEAGQDKAAGRGRWLKLALGLSLAVNLAVAGLVGGAVLRGGPLRDQMVRDVGFGPYAEALSPEDRQALRRAFLARQPDLRDLRQSMRQDMQAVVQALRAQPFDAAALESALVAQASRLQSQVQLGQSLLLERLSSMPEADRLAFAHRLESMTRRGPPDGGRQGDGGRDGKAP